MKVRMLTYKEDMTTLITATTAECKEIFTSKDSIRITRRDGHVYQYGQHDRYKENVVVFIDGTEEFTYTHKQVVS